MPSDEDLKTDGQNFKDLRAQRCPVPVSRLDEGVLVRRAR